MQSPKFLGNLIFLGFLSGVADMAWGYCIIVGAAGIRTRRRMFSVMSWYSLSIHYSWFKLLVLIPWLSRSRVFMNHPYPLIVTVKSFHEPPHASFLIWIGAYTNQQNAEHWEHQKHALEIKSTDFGGVFKWMVEISQEHTRCFCCLNLFLFQDIKWLMNNFIALVSSIMSGHPQGQLNKTSPRNDALQILRHLADPQGAESSAMLSVVVADIFPQKNWQPWCGH